MLVLLERRIFPHEPSLGIAGSDAAPARRGQFTRGRKSTGRTEWLGLQTLAVMCAGPKQIYRSCDAWREPGKTQRRVRVTSFFTSVAVLLEGTVFA